MNISFESRPCGRCNGVGRLNAYGHVMNGVCFGCGGSGTKATRNGLAARKVYNEAMTIEASELTVGMIVWTIGMDGRDRRAEIAEIKEGGTKYLMTTSVATIEVRYTNNSIHILEATSKLRMALSKTNNHLAVEALKGTKGATIT